MSIFDGSMKIEVAAASGIEAVVKRELLKLNYLPEGAEYGRIRFDGTLRDVARANVFLRTANRVRIVLARFTADTFDALYDGVKSVNWSDVLTLNAKIGVSAKSVKSKLFALSSIQSVTKKAIVADMCERFNAKSLAEDGADYDIEVAIFNDEVTLTLDTSGAGLHKRGYRTYVGAAPLRETTAAAMIELSVWTPERPFVDPFCGSGTLPVEAALIGLDIAPGVNRSFAFEQWSNAPSVRDDVTTEARDGEHRERELRISGFDIDKNAIKLALRHAENAGVKDKIHLQVGDMRNVSSRFSHGVIVTNPPYGERLMKEDELRALYRDFGTMYSHLDEWCCYAITSYRGFEKHFGKHADRTRRLYNSELECTLYQYLGAPPQKLARNANDNSTENK